jgi:hypothetical protein
LIGGVVLWGRIQGDSKAGVETPVVALLFRLLALVLFMAASAGTIGAVVQAICNRRNRRLPPATQS